MASQDKSDQATEVAMLDLIDGALEVAMEDGGSRATLGETVGMASLATADYATTNRPGVFQITFANGEQWEITRTARIIRTAK